MESGADDLPDAPIASAHTSTWVEERDARVHSGPDLSTFLYLENRAYAKFCKKWAAQTTAGQGGECESAVATAAALEAEAAVYEAEAARIASALNSNLWRWLPSPHLPEAAGNTSQGSQVRGHYVGFNARERTQLPARTYQAAWPCWARLAPSDFKRDAALDEICSSDLRGPFGIRSTSNADTRYTLTDMIVPYSNWRGPVWMNVNCVLCYTLAAAGRRDVALEIAEALTLMLAKDIETSGGMHENYSADDGAPVSTDSKMFLSWNVLAVTLVDNLRNGHDPFAPILE